MLDDEQIMFVHFPYLIFLVLAAHTQRKRSTGQERTTRVARRLANYLRAFDIDNR